MEAQNKTKTIEERLEGAKQEVARAREVLRVYEAIKKKKENLQSSFRYLMGKKDLEIQMANSPEQYGVTSLGELGQRIHLPLGKQDPALDALYGFVGGNTKRLFQSENWDLYDKIRESMIIYTDKIWDRTITESEYNSIVNATEPFIGRYLQRVYDVRQQEAEVFQRKIEAEERAYTSKHGSPAPAQPKEETKPAENIPAPQRTSLLSRLFGGKK